MNGPGRALASAAIALTIGSACGPSTSRSSTSEPTVGPTDPAEQLLALLPADPAVVVEVDLARLRANAAVGPLVTAVFASDLVDLPNADGATPADRGPTAIDRDGDGLPDPYTDANGDGVPDDCDQNPDDAEDPSFPDPNGFPPSEDEVAATGEAAAVKRKRWRRLCLPPLAPDQLLAGADLLVLGAYGVGTSEASTVTLVASDARVLGATQVGDSFWVLAGEEWIRQVEARAGLVAAGQAIAASEDLLALRAHATPTGAPGASLRLTARLSSDARRTLARQLGLVTAPARVAVWGDVVDDLAIIVDAEAAGDTDKPAEVKQAAERLDRAMRGALAALAEEEVARLVGLTASLGNARFESSGRWVRGVLAIGPKRLERIVKRVVKLVERGPVPPGTDAGVIEPAPTEEESP